MTQSTPDPRNGLRPLTKHERAIWPQEAQDAFEAATALTAEERAFMHRGYRLALAALPGERAAEQERRVAS